MWLRRIKTIIYYHGYDEICIEVLKCFDDVAVERFTNFFNKTMVGVLLFQAEMNILPPPPPPPPLPPTPSLLPPSPQPPLSLTPSHHFSTLTPSS